MTTTQYGHGPLADHAQGPLMPAEPCTEIGADTEDAAKPMRDSDRALMIVIGVASAEIASAFIWHVVALVKALPIIK